MRFIGRSGRPFTEEQTKRQLDVFERVWRERDFGVWAVERAEGGALLGWCGFLPFEGEDVELVYLLDEPYWHQGFATEAARAVVEWGVTERGWQRLVAVTYEENAASRRVLERLGWQFEGARRAYDRDLAAYVLVV